MTMNPLLQPLCMARGGPLVCLDVLAEHRYLNIVSACLEALMDHVDAISERDTVTYSVQLAVHEACVNIVEHAYRDQAKDRGQGRIGIGISLGGAPRQLVVDLYDDGRPFGDASTDAHPLGRLPKSDLPQLTDLGEIPDHGYGLYLMQQLVDEVQYERVQDRNHWQLSKAL